MRTNVNIADDARELAELYAHANGISLGDAITEMIRNYKKPTNGALPKPKFARSASGFPIFPSRGRVITTEMVLKAQEEDFV
jgi:histidinol dehydrogenase